MRRSFSKGIKQIDRMIFVFGFLCIVLFMRGVSLVTANVDDSWTDKIPTSTSNMVTGTNCDMDS